MSENVINVRPKKLNLLQYTCTLPHKKQDDFFVLQTMLKESNTTSYVISVRDWKS